MNLNLAYEVMKISFGTPLVHKTESVVSLNGSYDISFTMSHFAKVVGLF